MLRSLAVLVLVQQLSSSAAAQDLVFSAEAAVAVEDVGEAGAAAGAENVAAEEVSGDDGSGPVPELARQDLIPVGTFIRTCDCSTPKTVVRSSSHDMYNDMYIHHTCTCGSMEPFRTTAENNRSQSARK